MITERINIDVRPGGVPVVIHVTQYEAGLREFVFTPYTSAGELMVVAGSATLEGTKPDGYAFQQACEMIDGVITYTLQEQLCAVEGRVWSRLVVRDANGGMIGYTAIVWVVGGAGVKDDAVMSDSDISALRQFLDEFGTIDAYRGALNGALAAVGGPLVAATASAMTDRTKVYVYTGSESGYTEGHWYYWSGSAWTDGGVYQSTGINTDKTLTVEDMAADAKATGDAVAKLKNDLIENTTTTRNINVYPLGRYQIDNSGVIKPGTGTMLGIDGYIPVLPESRYTVTFYNSDNVLTCSKYVAFYKSDKTFISKLDISSNAQMGTFKTPELCGYICAYAYNGNGLPLNDNVHMQIEQGAVSTQYIQPTTFIDAVSREISEIVAESINVGVPLTELGGYYSAAGIISNPSAVQQEKYTQKIDCDIYQNIVCVNEFSEDRAMWCRYCTYDANGDLLNVYTAYNMTASVCSFGFVPLANEKYVSFSYRTYGVSNCFTVYATVNIGNTSIMAAETKDEVENLKLADTRSILAASDLFRVKPCYDHLFVSTPAEYITIPHESVYHVRLSKAFGFRYIECNIRKTSDGVYVVNHFNNGKFGLFFHHIDGVTDISTVDVSSVTWDWIVQNVRYTTRIEKYRTRPSRLEEILHECKQQNLIPMLQTVDDGVIAIADQIMGRGNYIAYGATRSMCPSSPIFTWESAATKEAILGVCNTYGKPYIYGMSNPTSFTDEQLVDIVNTLHDAGYWIGTSYADAGWYKYSYFGFDLIGAIRQINRMESGNICNYRTIYSFNDFTYTNATVTDGKLVFSSDGTLSPNVSTDTLDVCAFDLEIAFNGTISYVNKGEMIGQTITSDGSYPYFIAIPVINGNPKIDLSVSSGTVVTDIKFKASKI